MPCVARMGQEESYLYKLYMMLLQQNLYAHDPPFGRPALTFGTAVAARTTSESAVKFQSEIRLM